jgi:hypothetical protein
MAIAMAAAAAVAAAASATTATRLAAATRQPSPAQATRQPSPRDRKRNMATKFRVMEKAWLKAQQKARSAKSASNAEMYSSIESGTAFSVMSTELSPLPERAFDGLIDDYDEEEGGDQRNMHDQLEETKNYIQVLYTCSVQLHSMPAAVLQVHDAR